MKPTPEEFAKTAVLFSSAIPFFPQEELLVDLVRQELESMIATADQLAWFRMAALRGIRDWQKAGGLGCLRALFSTRYTPADGITPTFDMPGYSTEDLEAKAREREMAENNRRLAEYRRLAQLEGSKPLELPGEVLKSMDPPKSKPKTPRYTREEIQQAEAQLASAERKPAKTEAQRLAEIRDLEQQLKSR